MKGKVKKVLKQLGVKKAVQKTGNKLLNDTVKKLSSLALKHGSQALAGVGDYSVQISQPNGSGRGFVKSGGRKRPGVRVDKDGSMSLSHSEYVGDLVSGTSAGFVSQQYALNPGMAGTFPWLSGLAANFQQYEFEQLAFEFRTNVTSAVSTTTGSVVSMGQVMIGTQYNAASDPYINKQQLENSDYAVYDVPYKSLIHAIECKRGANVLNDLYVRTGNAPSGADIRLYDMGFTQVVNNAVPTNGVATSLGEVHVHYRVKLMKPQLNAGTSNLASAHYTGDTVSASQLWTSSSMTAVTDNAQSVSFSYTASGTHNVVTLPLDIEFGKYLMFINIAGGTSGAFTVGTVTCTNCTLVQAWSAGTASGAWAPQSGGTATNNSYMIMISVNAPGSALATVDFAGFTWAAYDGDTNIDFVMTPYNINMS